MRNIVTAIAGHSGTIYLLVMAIGMPYTKVSVIHVAVDALGNSIKVKLTGGQVHDVMVACALVADTKAQIILVKTAYDAKQRQ
ncbi:MAG: transposase [Selenomonadaceae bacterium]|nr:transposase [Selenomonadaceae bacterium]